jgi:hypothetical protein
MTARPRTRDAAPPTGECGPPVLSPIRTAHHLARVRFRRNARIARRPHRHCRALYFLQQVSKLDALTTSYIVGAGLLIGTPTLIFFGWLSDHIGRKPVILGGMLLAAVTLTRAG